MITIKNTNVLDSDLHNLINALDNELLSLYPADGIFGIDFSSPDVKRVNFFMAYLKGKAVGCGAYRPFESKTCEIKRFFIMPEYRHMGIASALLKHIETAATNDGYSLIKLETGPKQPEAINLYKKHGFYEIERYGEYFDCEYSLCFEKKL